MAVTLEDRLRAHAADVLNKHPNQLPDAVSALYKVLEDDPTLLFALIGEQQIRIHANNHLQGIID